MGTGLRQREIGMGQRQQAVVMAVLMAGPDQMSGKAVGLIPVAQRTQPREMIAVQRAVSADGQARQCRLIAWSRRSAVSIAYGGPTTSM